MGRFSLSLAISTDDVSEGAVVNPASRTIRTQMYGFLNLRKTRETRTIHFLVTTGTDGFPVAMVVLLQATKWETKD